MNIKPTPEQVDDWELEAAKYAESQTSEYYEYQQAKNEKFAELAAAWGAAQAQQTTVEEPELPEAVSAIVRRRNITTTAHAASDKKDHYSDWSEWRNESIDFAKAVTDPARNTNPYLYEMQLTYTAAQMHDHFQAGVRAGSAGSQDVKRTKRLEMYAALMDEAARLINEIDSSNLDSTVGFRWPLCDELRGAALIARDEIAAMKEQKQ